MEHLPFIVVHGAVVWCLALFLFLGCALLLVRWRPRRVARAHRRRTLYYWGPPASPAVEVDGQLITLTGRLAADGACARFDDGSDAAVVSAELQADTALCDRAPRLWLEVDGDRVEVEGAIQIAAGSQETWPGRLFEQLPLPVQERLLRHGVAPHLREGRPGFRSLHAGDAVVARGVLGVVGADGETDYRRPAHRFVLRSAALASDVPPRVTGAVRSRALCPTVAAGALFLFVFGVGGAVLDHHAEQGSGRGSLEEVLRGQRAAVLLSATPFHRASALERLAHVVEERGAPSLEVREAMVALADLRGDCAGAIDALLRHRQFRRALERGDSCDDPGGRALAARAAFLAGEVALASRHLAGDGGENDDVHESEMAIRVHLLAGDHARAARVARRLATRVRTRDPSLHDDARPGEERSNRALQLECIADAVEARAGNAASMTRLERAARPYPPDGCIVTVPPNVECQLLHLDLRSGSERTGPLGSARVAFGSWTATALFLSIEADPASPSPHLLLASDVFEAARGRMDELSHFSLGLDRSVLAALMAMKELPPWAEPVRPLLLARSALEESMLLRHDEARRLLSVAARDIREGVHGLPDLAPLTAMVELRAGDLTAAGSPLQARPELAAALRGGGRALAAALEENLDPPALVDSLALVARWLPREPLARYLRFARWNYKADLLGLDSAMRDLSNLALMAEAIGDSELAQELANGLRGIRAASLRRDIAMPLAVLERR